MREPSCVAVSRLPERVGACQVVVRGRDHGLLERPVGERRAPQGDSGERLDIAVSPAIVGQARAQLSPQQLPQIVWQRRRGRAEPVEVKSRDRHLTALDAPHPPVEIVEQRRSVLV